MTTEVTDLYPAMRSSILYRLTARLAGIFSAVSAALAASAAVENRRTPDAHDLRVLGIDPIAFAQIRMS